jgi:hypothetical protein
MAARVRYTQFDAVAREVGRQAAVDSARGMTRLTFLQAQAGVPVDTGTLSASGHYNVDRGISGAIGTVGYRADHAMAVHEGARPHVIRPRDPRGSLVFRAGGRLIFTKQVNHPGNQGNPWLYKALVHQARVHGYSARRTAAGA